MLSKSNGETLADKITGILNTAPTSFDPEDEDVDETGAQTVPHYLENDIEDVDTNYKQSLLKHKPLNFPLDADQRYSGSKTSRKRLRDEDSDEEDTFFEDNERNVSGNESDEDESDNEDGESYESTAESEEDNVSVENEGFKHLSTFDASNDVNKGLCVRNQINIWESLLEMRIQLQKCLLISNKMPQHDTYKEFKNAADETYILKLEETKATVGNLVDKFLMLQSLFLKQYPETKSLLTENNDTVRENSDEEIPSDTDEEADKNNDEEHDIFKSKRRKLSDYEHQMNLTHLKYQKYRNTVIQKWNDKTKILVSKTSDTASVLSQIEYVLNDKQRLLKRTRQKKSNYETLGKNTETNADDCDAEIFDDSDFYHQMLRELIEFRSADLTDPVQLGRQWVQLQSMRSKMKRNVDTRATKGRKIRYAVHSKLVNFMAPIDESKWSDEAKSDLYCSVFRGNQNVVTTNG